MANYIPIVVNFSALSLVNNLAVIKNVGGSPLIEEVIGYLKGLALGTFTVTIKNDAGDLITTLSWTEAGEQSIAHANLTTDYINKDDHFHINITSLGVAPDGLTLIIWLEQADS